MSHRYPLRRWIIAVAIILGAGNPLVTTSWAQRRPQQFGSLTIAAPPRELRRNLERAQKAIAAEQYTEAVELLDAILSAENAEDFFLSDGKTTLKSAACRVLGTLPRRGREFYELQVGHTARRALADAVAQRDLNHVGEISRRFFHTDAGYEATFLLARAALDKNLPTTALIHLRRLRDAHQASGQYEPQLSIWTAVCHYLRGEAEEAASVLEEARQSYPQARFQLADQSLRLDDGVDRIAQLIDQFATPLSADAVAAGADWALFRGTPDRNGVTSGGMPLAKLEWRVSTAVFVSDENRIARAYEQLQQQKRASIPAASPLAVGRWVVMQGARRVLGIDLHSGKRIWPYPWDDSQTRPQPTSSNRSLELRLRARSGLLADPHYELRKKTWLDAVHSQLSSNGKYLYLLRDTEQEHQRSAINIRTHVATKHRPNHLVALELETEGKTIWAQGGEEGDLAELADAFFLGPPLPIDDQLYVVAELKDELRLLVLDAATGQLAWSQQLGQVESPSPYGLRNEQRDLGGSCLAYADGILVCPTTSGRVVAVDTQRRWLLWHYSYQSNAGVHRSASFRNRGAQSDVVGQQWADGTPIIAKGHVVVTPTDSTDLHCLDLLTGERKWKMGRGKAIYVAGIWDGTVVVVGQNNIHGVDLVTGKTMWQSEPYPADGIISGRGFYHDRFFYFPTTAQHLIRMDLTEGRFVETLDTELPLGNLICHGNYVISQSHDALVALLLRDRIRPNLELMLKQRPDDPLVLENYASLLLSDHKDDEALAVLRKAAKLPVDETQLSTIRTKLASLLLKRLEADFASNKPLIAEVRDYLDNDRLRLRYSRALASGYYQAGASQPAMQALLELIALPTTDTMGLGGDELIRSDDGRQIHGSIWLAQLAADILSSADPADRAACLQMIAQQAQTVIASGERQRMLRFCRCLDGTAEVKRVRYELARVEATSGRAIEAELHLAQLRHRLRQAPGNQRELAVKAATQLGELLANYGETAAGLQILREVAQVAPNIKVAGDTTPAQLLAKTEAHRQAPKYSVANWPRGRVERDDAAGEGIRRLQRRQPIPVRPTDGLWSPRYRVEIDRQHLTILDGFNRLRRKIGVQKERATPFVTYAGWDAVARGHLIVLGNGVEVLAVDALGDYEDSTDRVLWRRDTSESGRMPRPQSSRLGQKLNGLEPASSQLGPASQTSVAVVERGDLVCRDLLTGAPLWKVSDVGVDAALFGDDEVVLVVRDHQDTEADAYSMRDGTAMGTVTLPFQPDKWRAFGRLLLGWNIEQNRIELSAYDTQSAEQVWRRLVDKDSEIQIIERHALAVCQPDGALEIIDLHTGNSEVTATVNVGDQLGSLVVIPAPDQYVVGIGQQKAPLRANRIHRTTSGFTFSGWLYAFNRSDGQPAWPEPTFVRDYVLCDRQVVETPIIVFLRSYELPQSQSNVKGKRAGEVACLDRRNGSIVFRGRQATPQPNCLIVADPDEAKISLHYQYNRANIQLTFVEGQPDQESVNKLEPADVETEDADQDEPADEARQEAEAPRLRRQQPE